MTNTCCQTVQRTCTPDNQTGQDRKQALTASEVGSSTVQLPCKLLESPLASSCRQARAPDRTRLAWRRSPPPSASLLSLSDES